MEHKVIEISVDLHSANRRCVELEKELSECQDYVIQQHDLGFLKALDQVAYFFQIPLDKGKFDAWKVVYKGELMAIEDILDNADDKVVGGKRVEKTPHIDVVNITLD